MPSTEEARRLLCELGDHVRGLVVGRAPLFPPDGDAAAAVDIAAELVHGVNPGA